MIIAIPIKQVTPALLIYRGAWCPSLGARPLPIARWVQPRAIRQRSGQVRKTTKGKTSICVNFHGRNAAGFARENQASEVFRGHIANVEDGGGGGGGWVGRGCLALGSLTLWLVIVQAMRSWPQSKTMPGGICCLYLFALIHEPMNDLCSRYHIPRRWVCPWTGHGVQLNTLHHC